MAEASAAVERREASAFRCTRGHARSADGWQHPLRGEAPRDSRAYRRSASLYFLEAKVWWLWSASLGRTCVAGTSACVTYSGVPLAAPSPRVRGEGWVEGAVPRF